MLKKRSRTVDSKQGLMAENSGSVTSPTDKFSRHPTSSFFSSPRLFTCFSPKGFSDSESVMSPTSILDAKTFSCFGNPLWSENCSRTPDNVAEHRHAWEKRGSEGIGLGIVDALSHENRDKNISKPESRMVLFGSQLKITIPLLQPSAIFQTESPGPKTSNSQIGSFSSDPMKRTPINSACFSTEILNSPRLFTGCLSATEMELSEDYTCVISHGPNPKTTHIFDNCIIENCCGVEFSVTRKENYLVADRPVYPSDDFLSFCYACKRSLGEGKDIYMYSEDCSKTLLDATGGSSHTDAIRAICFDAKGRHFGSAGDDKLVKIWATDSWHCIQTVCSEKRVCAVAFSHDGMFLTFADKFGVVWVVSINEAGGDHVLINKKAVPILAHYCSIITGLKFSPDGKFIASADRDFKIRVTMFPKRPLNEAHEIQSFCLGHTDFVSCLTFVCPSDDPQGFLLSGSGDSTVRLWDFVTGHLLDTCDVGAKAGLIQSNEREEAWYPAVTDICASPDGSVIAVAIQSLHGVMLLRCDFEAGNLSVSKIVALGESFIPTGLGIGSSAESLWVVTGASSAAFARVRVISISCQSLADSGECEPVVLDDDAVPGGERLLQKLQGKSTTGEEEEALATAADAVKAAMRNLLIKRQYSVEKRELRKKSRNDRKLKH